MKKKVIKQSNNFFVKKILTVFFSIIIIIFLFFITLKDQFNVSQVLKDLTKQIGLFVEFEKESIWDIYPEISFHNPKVSLKDINSSLIIKNSSIKIIKSYWPFSPFYIYLDSPIIVINGIEIKNASIKANYKNKILKFENFTGNLVGGNIEATGYIKLKEEMPFNIKGKLYNISLNTILQQSEIAVWDRIKIQLSSENFDINGNAKNKKNILKFLNGKAEISGSVYFNASDEERFGAALLSLLGDKLPSIFLMSKSINFLISTYGNVPTSIIGDIIIENEKIFTDNIEIINNIGKSSMNAKVDLNNGSLQGKIFFYENNEVFLETNLKGNINNPKILIEGISFEENDNSLKDLKSIFEEGINTLIDKLLKVQ